jgi:hypothetical protein
MQQVRADRAALGDLHLAFATFRRSHRRLVARWLSENAMPVGVV